MAKSPERKRERERRSYPLGVVSRLTGLSPDVLRAWERRYGVVAPLRTPGGTRRYREADVRRLRLLASATTAGHSIGKLVELDDDQLVALSERSEATPPVLDEALEALRNLDAARADQVASTQLALLGPTRFAREFALPLAAELGRGWRSGEYCIASEHLGTSILRSLLGAGLRPTLQSVQAPGVLFSTPPGERHELGLLVAALITVGAGGNPIYLGPDLPVEEIVQAAETASAAAVALSVVTLTSHEAERLVRAIRGGLPEAVELWLGGERAAQLDPPHGADHLATFEDLEQKIMLLLARQR